MSDLISLIPVVIIVAACLILLWTYRWRINLIALAVIYVAVFWLTAQSWPISLAVVKLIAGWMGAAVLGASQSGTLETEADQQGFAGRAFRIFSGLFILIVVFSIAPSATGWLPTNSNVVLGGLILIAFGLLQLGLTTQTFRVILGLLIVFAGFEIIYASVVVSILVAGLLAGLNLGLAMMGSYLLSLNAPEESS